MPNLHVLYRELTPILRQEPRRGYRIPQPIELAGSPALDVSRLQRISEETERAAAALAAIFDTRSAEAHG